MIKMPTLKAIAYESAIHALPATVQESFSRIKIALEQAQSTIAGAVDFYPQAQNELSAISNEINQALQEISQGTLNKARLLSLVQLLRNSKKYIPDLRVYAVDILHALTDVQTGQQS